MVKAVVGEETQLQLAEDRLSQSGLSSQVGLVIGKLSSTLDRGFVFDLVPTPPNDAGEPACSLIESVKDDKKKGSKGKSQSESSSLFIDKDWVAEHARQVSRMLLGGMKVVGIYIWVNESSFKNSTIVIFQTVKGVAEAAPLMETNWDERLLIHISYSPRRWTCRNCTVASIITSNSLRPCDFKMGRVLTSLQMLRCTYNFDLRQAYAFVLKEKSRRGAMLQPLPPDRSALVTSSQDRPSHVPSCSDNKRGNSDKDHLKCDYCGKRRHTRDHCWKLHGRPTGDRGRGRFGSTRSHAHMTEAPDVPEALPPSSVDSAGLSNVELQTLRRMMACLDGSSSSSAPATSNFAHSGTGDRENDWQW